ncbi:hypothetical protein STRMA_0318 [Streptococcus macacae NCTC 11558]|uniref:Uncharacterized protein n=1 Tax=Streptococcus macacae NCTC 11558 TaxID=764298 RepID=G5JYQ5_9STRE|nr:hypothetical protein STRMA_0318 [Streptococcus macacae NCTC 11558]
MLIISLGFLGASGLHLAKGKKLIFLVSKLMKELYILPVEMVCIL